ncbi:MAG: RpiB/LacA/LacB family sugar-phosphate isomerase [Chthonomonas sp.]|nr:RpiB/LacA/LacB family sugar-phosphate isomerase [Chthonomonas sp.]
MKLIFGSDHAGHTLRRVLVHTARRDGHECVEVGAMGEDPYDYPDAADDLAPRILSGEFELGVLICGSGIGICIRANRHPGIRAANCWNVESAKLARLHNHANVLCLGERLVEAERAVEILTAFLKAPEDHAERHERRVGKLDAAI